MTAVNGVEASQLGALKQGPPIYDMHWCGPLRKFWIQRTAHPPELGKNLLGENLGFAPALALCRSRMRNIPRRREQPMYAWALSTQ